MQRTNQPFDKKSDAATSPASNHADGLTPGEAQAVRAAEAIAQGQDHDVHHVAGDPGGGTAAPPPPAPSLTNAGRLAARIVDQILFRVFGPAGPLPPTEQSEAEQCWSELLTEIGVAIPMLGPGGKLLVLYGTHIGALYAIQWLTEPEKPSSPGNQDAAKPPS